MPDEPAIIVHPNWAAKSGKFDCSIMSLSVLLDYRLEDNKEHSFEVISSPNFLPSLFLNNCLRDHPSDHTALDTII